MDRLDFSLDQLTAFVAVVEAGGFVAAGRRLGRAQSAVSHAVSNLESALSTRLFERTGRKARLTPAGERLLSEAHLVLSQARGLRECAAALEGGVEARLSIALDWIFPHSALADACRDLEERFPAVTLHLRRRTLDGILALVRSGAVDFGVGNLMGSIPDSLVTRPCRSTNLIPVCGRSHALARAPAPQPESALRESVQILLSDGSRDAAPDRGVIASRVWRVSDLGTKLHLVRMGVGWGTLPLDRIEGLLASGDLVRLHPAPWPEGHVVALHTIVKEGNHLGPAGRWLRSALSSVGASN